jgi:hypothetical protein
MIRIQIKKAGSLQLTPLMCDVVSRKLSAAF